jgi:uncharacterized protein (DUF779 family)
MSSVYPFIPPNPGTAATNYGQSWNPAIGNPTTNPATNYLVGENGVVNGMIKDIFTNWQTQNGAPQLFPADPQWASSYYPGGPGNTMLGSLTPYPSGSGQVSPFGMGYGDTSSSTGGGSSSFYTGGGYTGGSAGSGVGGYAGGYAGGTGFVPFIPPNPGTAATNYGQSWNPAIGNPTTNPATNYLVGENGVVNGMINDIFTNWQTQNGAPQLFPADPQWASSYYPSGPGNTMLGSLNAYPSGSGQVPYGMGSGDGSSSAGVMDTGSSTGSDGTQFAGSSTDSKSRLNLFA